MIRRPPRSTRTDTLLPYPTLFRSLAEKTGRFAGSPADRPELLSWLFFIASGIGPYSGQAVHFQLAAPEKLPYAINRYRREVDRHYQVLDQHLAGRDYIVGSDYTIADISAWRSEERRDGKEVASTCRSWWSPCS